MKLFFSIVMTGLFIFISGCAHKPMPVPARATSQPRVVEASCGQCLFGLKEKKGCDLAVRFDGRSYFVDGVTMKQLGDAHAADGMCSTVRQAKVTGHVANNRFIASSFELLPPKK